MDAGSKSSVEFGIISPKNAHFFCEVGTKTQYFTFGKYSAAKSTEGTWKLFPFKYSNEPASVVKQKVSL